MSSIPHATSPVAVHALSVSPTNNNAASPIKESPLADPTTMTMDSATFSEERAAAEPDKPEESVSEAAEDDAPVDMQD